MSTRFLEMWVVNTSWVLNMPEQNNFQFFICI